jgi:5-deoxy-glucuronate isomerase
MAITVDPQALLLRSSDLGTGSGVLIEVDSERAGWEFCGLTVVKLATGERWSRQSGSDEVALVPLGGRCTVTSAGTSWMIGERTSPFTGPPWALYLPRDSEFAVVAETPLELAVTTARAERTMEPQLVTPADVKIEIRGAGNAARQINHIVEPSFPADRLLVVEVFTPSGNWSSYPPHKHDDTEPCPVVNEEIYYFRIAGANGFGFHRTYTADGALDENVVVRDGDVFLIPRGYHGPCVAAPGYPMYYLNVLAGPGADRSMAFCDDPAHTWVRDSWAGQAPDPRCPVTTAEGCR